MLTRAGQDYLEPPCISKDQKLLTEKDNNRRTTEIFFERGSHRAVCDLIGIDPDSFWAGLQQMKAEGRTFDREEQEDDHDED